MLVLSTSMAGLARTSMLHCWASPGWVGKIYHGNRPKPFAYLCPWWECLTPAQPGTCWFRWAFTVQDKCRLALAFWQVFSLTPCCLSSRICVLVCLLPNSTEYSTWYQKCLYKQDRVLGSLWALYLISLQLLGLFAFPGFRDYGDVL